MKSDNPLDKLPGKWRQRADSLLEWGAPSDWARTWHRAADELERSLAAYGCEPLRLETAAAESGYTVGHLRRLLRDCTLQNAGTEEEPAILRCHLPRKPGPSAIPMVVDGAPDSAASSREQDARAVANGEVSDGE